MLWKPGAWQLFPFWLCEDIKNFGSEDALGGDGLSSRSSQIWRSYKSVKGMHRVNKQFLDEDTKDSAIIEKSIHEQTQLEKLILQNQETLHMMARLMKVVSSSNSP